MLEPTATTAYEVLPSQRGEPVYGLLGATRHIEAMTRIPPEHGVLVAFTVRVQKYLAKVELDYILNTARRDGFIGYLSGHTEDYDVLYFRNEATA